MLLRIRVHTDDREGPGIGAPRLVGLRRHELGYEEVLLSDVVLNKGRLSWLIHALRILEHLLPPHKGRVGMATAEGRERALLVAEVDLTDFDSIVGKVVVDDVGQVITLGIEAQDLQEDGRRTLRSWSRNCF